MFSTTSKYFLTLLLVIFFLPACSEDEQSSKTEQIPDKAKVELPAMAESAAEVKARPEPEQPAAKKLVEKEVVESMPVETSTLVPEAVPELKHDVVYEKEIYKNWPYQSSAMGGGSEGEASITSALIPEPVSELKHDVVSGEEIYKNWPYQEEARNLTEASMTEQAMDSAKGAMDSLASEAEGKMVEKLADVTGQSTESVAGVVAVAKEAMGSTKKTTAASGGAVHVINAKGLTAFDRPIIYIAPGDTVHFKRMNGGHNSKSVFSPEGGEEWEGAMNKNISVTLTVPGIYGYLCVPHAGLGMNGVIVVGDAGDKEVVMEKLRGLPQTDFSRKLLGRVNKVKAENYLK